MLCNKISDPLRGVFITDPLAVLSKEQDQSCSLAGFCNSESLETYMTVGLS